MSSRISCQVDNLAAASHGNAKYACTHIHHPCLPPGCRDVAFLLLIQHLLAAEAALPLTMLGK